MSLNGLGGSQEFFKHVAFLDFYRIQCAGGNIAELKIKNTEDKSKLLPQQPQSKNRDQKHRPKRPQS